MENTQNKTSVPKIIIIYELVLGFFELISGLGILLFGNMLLSLYENLKNTEFIQDPNDLTIRFTERLIPNLFADHITVALFLLAFGIIKIASGVGLLYKKIWAEHLLIIFLLILIPFELFAFLKHLSIADLIYLLIDVTIILYLIKLRPLEYFRRLKQDVLSKKN